MSLPRREIIMKKGFSLIEIMVVLAIISVFVIMAMGSRTSVQNKVEEKTIADVAERVVSNISSFERINSSDFSGSFAVKALMFPTSRPVNAAGDGVTLPFSGNITASKTSGVATIEMTWPSLTSGACLRITKNIIDETGFANVATTVAAALAKYPTKLTTSSSIGTIETDCGVAGAKAIVIKID